MPTLKEKAFLAWINGEIEKEKKVYKKITNSKNKLLDLTAAEMSTNKFEILLKVAKKFTKDFL